MKRFACLVNQSRRMREECEQNTLSARSPAGTSHQAESTSISGKSATFLPPSFRGDICKSTKETKLSATKPSCRRRRRRAAVAKSFCGEECSECVRFAGGLQISRISHGSEEANKFGEVREISRERHRTPDSNSPHSPFSSLAQMESTS